MIYQLVSRSIEFGARIPCRLHAPDLEKVYMRGLRITYSNRTGQTEAAILFGHIQPRPITGLAKMEAWDNTFLDWLLNLVNPIV